MTQPANSHSLRNFLIFVACGFGTGFVSRMPGTVGALVAVPVVLLFQLLSSPLQWLICAAMFVFGCWICEFAVRKLEVADPRCVVWDEITGYCIALVALPATAGTMIAAFVIFRALDILKPFPINWCERRFKGGFGIMLDDAVAGIATNLILIFLLRSFAA